MIIITRRQSGTEIINISETRETTTDRRRGPCTEQCGVRTTRSVRDAPASNSLAVQRNQVHAADGCRRECRVRVGRRWKVVPGRGRPPPRRTGRRRRRARAGTGVPARTVRTCGGPRPIRPAYMARTNGAVRGPYPPSAEPRSAAVPFRSGSFRRRHRPPVRRRRGGGGYRRNRRAARTFIDDVISFRL